MMFGGLRRKKKTDDKAATSSSGPLSIAVEYETASSTHVSSDAPDSPEIRSKKQSFGKKLSAHTQALNPNAKVIVPESAVDINEMMEKVRQKGSVTFEDGEFAWFWLKISRDRSVCFETASALLQIIVDHLRTGRKTQEVVAFATNTLAFLYLYGLIRPEDEPSPRVKMAIQAMKDVLDKYTEDAPGKERTQVEQCAIDLVRIIARHGGKLARSLCQDLQDYTSFGAVVMQMQQQYGAAQQSVGVMQRSFFDMPAKFGFSFFWPRLLDTLDEEEEMNQLLTKVKEYLARHGEQLGTSSRIQILVLIMILRELITLRPTADINWLSSAINAVKPYYQWPRPYSLIAKQLLEDLTRECLCPGAALRRRLRLEHPELNPCFEEQDEEVEFITGSGSETWVNHSQWRLSQVVSGHGVLHVIHDSLSPLAKTYKEFFDNPDGTTMNKRARGVESSMDRPPVVSEEYEDHLRRLKEQIILQMLSFEFDLSGVANHDDPLELRERGTATIDTWYQKVCEVEIKVGKLSDLGSFGERMSIAKIVRESMLSALLKQIMPNHQFNIWRCAPESRRQSLHLIKGMFVPAAASQQKPMAQVMAQAIENQQKPSSPPPGDLPPGFSRNFQLDVPDVDFSFWGVNSLSTSTWRTLSELIKSSRETMPQNTTPGQPEISREGQYLHFPDDLATLSRLISTVVESQQPTRGPDLDDDEDFNQKSIHRLEKRLASVSHRYNSDPGGAAHFSARELNSDARTVNGRGEVGDDSEEAMNAAAEAAAEALPVLKLIIMGDNDVVHRFLQTYVALRQLKPDLYHEVRIQVYVVPLQEKRNDLAQYFAIRDPWYERHIFSAFARGLKLAPMFDRMKTIPSQIANQLNMRDLLPITRMHSLLQDYTRIADQEVPVCAFECQAWAGDEGSAEDSPDVRIPFITSAQIGFLVDVELYRQGERTLEARYENFRDVLKSENFHQQHLPYAPKDLIVISHPPTLQADSVDPTRAVLEAEKEAEEAVEDEEKSEQQAHSYATLLFTNMAAHLTDEVMAEYMEEAGDAELKTIREETVNSNTPVHKDLKMHVREWTGGIQSALSHKSLTKKQGAQVMKLFREEMLQSDPKQIGGVSIESANDSKFAIMLDGVAHGPFKRVVLAPLRLGDDDTRVLKVPFMTFLPLVT